MFRVLIEWLRQPRVKNWNNAFLAKQRWMTIWQEWKKCNSLIGETKNRLENLRQNYFTSWLPRNLNEKHDILMFLFLKISDLKIWFFGSFIAYLLLLFHSQTMTPRNCLKCSFPLQYQYILQPTVLENKETYQIDKNRQNWWTEERKTVTKYKDWARFVQNKKKGRLGTWKSIAHHPLHKLSAQG